MWLVSIESIASDITDSVGVLDAVLKEPLLHYWAGSLFEAPENR